MKTQLKVSSLLILVLFLFAGCEKDPSHADKNALRISEMANVGGENLTLFQYNADGLLSKVDYVNYYYNSIGYDAQNRPIKSTRFYNDNPTSGKATNIEWTDDGFIITYSDYNDQTIYILDAEGRIIKRSSTDDNGIVSNLDEYTWVGESKVIKERKDASGEIYETIEVEFGDVYNPFYDINVALKEILDLNVHPDSEENGHCKYAFSAYIVDGGYTQTASYEVNEQGFPIKSTFNYTYNNSNEYMYYEYETK